MDETQGRPEASTPSRKRRLDSDDDSEPARLTRKNLARFNKMGNSKKASNPLDDSDDTSTTKSLSITAPVFCVRAAKNGILHPIDSEPPKNLRDIRKRLSKTRASASPPESEYGRYVDAVEDAENETTMLYEVGRKLLKDYDDRGYKKSINQAWTGYPKDAGFNNGLSAPQPDFIEGPKMSTFGPFPVDDIPGAVLMKDNRHSITLPHIAGEVEGPEGDMSKARLQSSYDGAALVYARNQALAYQGKSDPPGHASITTFTTDGNELNFFAHYAAPNESGTLEYHQFPLESILLASSYKYYKEGRKVLRNEQDHAKKQSQALRDDLKEYYERQRGGNSLHPIAEGVLDTRR